MKSFGFLGLGIAVIGVILGLITWILQVFVIVEYESALYWALVIADLLEMFCVFGGIGLVALGLMMVKK